MQLSTEVVFVKLPSGAHSSWLLYAARVLSYPHGRVGLVNAVVKAAFSI